MTYYTPLSEQYRLFEQDKLLQPLGADYGKTLDSVLTDYYGGLTLASLTSTFTDDFDNVAGTVGDNNGGKTWCAPSTELQAGSTSFSKYSDGCYTQADATNIGLVVQRSAGVFKHMCNMSTATYGTNYDSTPIINWCQQFGYFEARFQAGDPTGLNVTLWPGFWMRSLHKFGGTGVGETGDPFRVDIEDDIVEAYASDPNTFTTQDRAMHITLHKHEPLKLVGPGQWGRDVSCGNYVGLRNQAALGTDNTFELWTNYRLWSELIAPDYRWYFFDRHLVGKLVQIPELHDRYVPYLWHAVQGEGTGGWISGPASTMLVDYVKCYQNTDWQTAPGGNQLTSTALTGGGTNNAKTLTSAIVMGAYANGRTFVAKFPNANTGACTLNVNGLGAKNIYKKTNVDIFPNTGTAIALTGGEIGTNDWKAFQYQTALNGGAGGFLLINPNFSMERPSRWSPTNLSRAAVNIDVKALEAGLVEKHGVDRLLFPVDHPARVPAGIPAFTAPTMAVNKTYRKVAGLTQGTSIATVTVTNTPTDTIRYHQVGAESHYTVNPATGEITVANGYTTTVGVEEFLVYAWPTTPRPLIRGSNATRVIMDIRSDDDFDFRFFNNLALWLDAQDNNSLILDASNNVTLWNDKSPVGAQFMDDATLTTDVLPVYNATALNSLPAVVSTTGAKMLTAYAGGDRSIHSRVNNLVTRSTPALSIQLQGSTRIANNFDFITNITMALFVWTPAGWTLWINGTEVGPLAGQSQTGILSNGFAFYVLDAASAGGGGLGQVYNGGRLFNDSTLTRGLDAALGEFAIADDAVDQSLIDKIFGYAANHWNLRSLLPVGHPYKSTTPKMWR